MNIYKQTKTGNSQLLLVFSGGQLLLKYSGSWKRNRIRIFGFAMTTGEWILKEKPFPDTGKSDW